MTPLSVYIHIPFCTVKCGYCDFNAYAGMDALKGAYHDALLAEIHGYRETLACHDVVSIGFGGGTPGEVPASYIGEIVAAINESAPSADRPEVTLEANPGTTSIAYFAGLHAAGVNRLSLGAQSFDPAHLQFLDRIHSVDAIAASLRGARSAGFQNVSLDLIYGLPGQDVDHWRRQLAIALALQPDHLSCYALTVEEGTPLDRRVTSGEVVLPAGDQLADMYEAAEATFNDAGFEHYELSNWARPGHQSDHNRAYWTDRPYLGVGAGAHGYIDGQRYENIAHPRAYIAAVADPGIPHAVAEDHELSRETVVADWITLRLRLVEGFAPDDFRARFGIPLDAAVGAPFRAAVQADWLEVGEHRVRLTPAGRLLHGELAVRLIEYLDREPLPPVSSAPGHQ